MTRWTASWGRNFDERTRQLPGDDPILDPLRPVTRSIAIDSPASEVRPWIAQTGLSQLGRVGCTPMTG